MYAHIRDSLEQATFDSEIGGIGIRLSFYTQNILLGESFAAPAHAIHYSGVTETVSN